MGFHENELTSKMTYITRLIYRKIDQCTLKYGLTVEQGRTILFLHYHKDKDVYLTDLAKAFNLRKSTLTSSLNNLEKLGCITRISSPLDQRHKKIELTELGEQKFELIHQLFVDSENKVKNSLSQEQIELMNNTLNIIIDAIKTN